MKTAEGTVDDRGCHYVFITTKDRHRTSNITSSIDEFNQNNPSENAMRLQCDIDQPMIVTMSSKKVKGPIFYRITEDRRKKHKYYWHWEPECDEENHFQFRDPNEKVAQVLNNNQKEVMVETEAVMQTSRVTRLLEINMIPSSLNPVSSKRNHLSNTKPASLIGKISLYIN